MFLHWPSLPASATAAAERVRVASHVTCMNSVLDYGPVYIGGNRQAVNHGSDQQKIWRKKRKEMTKERKKMTEKLKNREGVVQLGTSGSTMRAGGCGN